MFNVNRPVYAAGCEEGGGGGWPPKFSNPRSVKIRWSAPVGRWVTNNGYLLQATTGVVPVLNVGETGTYECGDYHITLQQFGINDLGVSEIKHKAGGVIATLKIHEHHSLLSWLTASVPTALTQFLG